MSPAPPLAMARSPPLMPTLASLDRFMEEDDDDEPSDSDPQLGQEREPEDDDESDEEEEDQRTPADSLSHSRVVGGPGDVACAHVGAAVRELRANFHLPDLEADPTWACRVWEAQFTECPPLPSSYAQRVLTEHVQLRSAMHKVAQSAKAILAQGSATPPSDAPSVGTSPGAVRSSASGFWSTLNDSGIQYRSLIALLFQFMDAGQKFESGQVDRQLCLQATSLYFIFLALPGSGAFKIFHPVLYQKALGTFKLASKLKLGRISPRQKKSQSSRQTKSKHAPPPRNRFIRTTSVSSTNLLDEDFDFSDEDDPGLLSEREIRDLTNALNAVIYDFHVFLDHHPLKRSLESMELTVSELVELTHLETSFANLDFGHSSRRSDLSALAFNAYCALEKICHPLHGDLRRSLLLILKCLLPAILMTHRGSSEIAPRGLTIIREHSLHFVKHLMRRIGEDSHGAIEVLIQHLALQVPDKAEYRAKTSLAIVTLMRDLSVNIFNRVVRWIFAWAHNEKVAHRQFALEVMGRLMQENERSHDASQNEQAEDPSQEPSIGIDLDEGVPVPNPTSPDASKPVQKSASSSYLGDLVSHKFIFGVIFSRCRDVSATVRAKALQTLADITAANNPTIIMVIQSMMEQHQGAASQKPLPMGNDDMVDFAELLGDESADLASINPLPSAACFTEFLRKRALDDSVYVRKNALQVIVNVLKFSEDLLRDDLVSILSEHCRDSSLMVRKLMAGALTDLLRTYPTKTMMIRHWVDGLFPLILDVEQKAAEKVMEGVWECLFGNLVPFSDASREAHFLPWKILESSEELKMTKYLSRACGIWAKEGQLKANMIMVLKTHVHTENNDLAWLLLSLISGHVSIADPHFVMEYFNTSIHTPEGVGLYTLQQVLRVLFSSVIRLSTDEQKLLQKDLILLVQRFAIPPELIPTAVDIASVVSNIESGDNLKLYQTAVDEWTSEIIEAIDHDLSEKILNPSGEDVEDVPMMRKIFTLGELAQISPHKINKRLFLLMQSIIFQQGTKHRRTRKKEEPTTKPSSQTQSSQPPPCAFQPTTRLQALTIVTLAKMCLQHEDMAKKIIPAFGQILDTSGDNAVKNNIMYALTDMCVRYASLVDPLIPQITACLKDDSLAVRRSTLITLIHLLQEDYLKMSGRGAFFFRIMQTLNDDSDEIRHLTTFYLQQRLIKRKPKVMFQHFTEALFHFNEYEMHETYNKFTISEREKRLFSMKGVEYREDRMKLYRFMLECMSDEQRFQTTYRLCKDILEGAVEGQVVLGQESYELLRDTFRCLSCEEIKLASLKSKADDPEEANNTGVTGSAQTEDMSGAIQSALKKNIISQVVKKNVIENIIPIIIALKHRLEALGSGLLDDLMTYLRELMKDYKNEVKDMLAADKNLATEIENDLKKWEEEQKKLEEARREAESQEKSPSQRDLLLRAVVESAVNVFQQKQKDLEQRRQAGEIIDDDSLSSQSGDPLDEFLTKNVSKAGQDATTNLSTLLSPKVVVQDVLGDLIIPPNGTPKSSTARSIGRSPRPSLNENRTNEEVPSVKRRLISSYDEPQMVVAEESILMTEADQEHLAEEVLSELHSVHQGQKSVITSVPTLAEINKELEIVVSQTKRKHKLKKTSPDDPPTTPMPLTSQGDTPLKKPDEPKSPEYGSTSGRIGSCDESTNVNSVDADGELLKKTDKDPDPASEIIDEAVNSLVAIDANQADKNEDVNVPAQPTDLVDEEKNAKENEEEQVQSTEEEIHATEEEEDESSSKVETPSSPGGKVTKLLEEEPSQETLVKENNFEPLDDHCEDEDGKLQLSSEEDEDEPSNLEGSPPIPVEAKEKRKRRKEKEVPLEKYESRTKKTKMNKSLNTTNDESQVRTESSEEDVNGRKYLEISNTPRSKRDANSPRTCQLPKTSKKASESKEEVDLVSKPSAKSTNSEEHQAPNRRCRPFPSKKNVQEKVKFNNKKPSTAEARRTRGTKRKKESLQECPQDPAPSTPVREEDHPSSPPKRRRTLPKRIQEIIENEPPKASKNIKETKSNSSPVRAGNRTLALRATEMETTATPTRSYPRVSRVEAQTPKQTVPVVLKRTFNSKSRKQKRKRVLPFLRSRRKSVVRAQKTGSSSSAHRKDQENRVDGKSPRSSSEDSEITFNLSQAISQTPQNISDQDNQRDEDPEVSFKAQILVPLIHRLPDKSILNRHNQSSVSSGGKKSPALKEVSFKEPSKSETSSTRRFQLATKAKEKRQSMPSATDSVPSSATTSVSSRPLRPANFAKTHEARLKNVLRAISTPNRQGVSQDNLTFLEQSQDLSAIPILSPPSTRKKRGPPNRQPKDQSASDGSALSFRFGRKVKDPFEEMLKRDAKSSNKAPQGQISAAASSAFSPPAVAQKSKKASPTWASPRSKRPNKKYLE